MEPWESTAGRYAELKSPRLRIGPPQKLALPGSLSQIAVSRDSQVVGQASYPAAGGSSGLTRIRRLYWLTQTCAPLPLVPMGAGLPRVHTMASHRIWEADSGKLLKDLMPENPSRGVDFSRDGQWLATQYPSCQLWKAGSWEKAREIQGAQFGSLPDGKMLAVETGSGVVPCWTPRTAGNSPAWKTLTRKLRYAFSLARMAPGR